MIGFFNKTLGNHVVGTCRDSRCSQICNSHVCLWALKSDSGQMVVELAVLIPVMLVAAAISMNLLSYMGDCARFDKVSSQAVRVYGISPGYGDYGKSACVSNIKRAIETEFAGSENVEVDVSGADIGSISGSDVADNAGILFSLIPSFRKYTCVMEYKVPFFEGGAFGIEFPSQMHTREYVVDVFKSEGLL